VADVHGVGGRNRRLVTLVLVVLLLSVLISTIAGMF
jgi:hypothetical protein